MTTIALVGIDGAGKTTIARRLLADYPHRFKYLYMGISVGSSNVSLPTTRFLYRRKMRGYDDGEGQVADQERHALETRVVQRGRLGTAARVLNRMAEEWYRLLVARGYERQGYVVLFDRHFRFEYARRLVEDEPSGTAVERFHYWSLRHLYPVPGLTLFLDVPPEVAIARKSEWPLARLSAYRKAILTVGQDVDNFTRLDATWTVDDLMAEIQQLITPYLDQSLFSSSAPVSAW